VGCRGGECGFVSSAGRGWSGTVAVLDNPSLEWVDLVGVGESVAEFRWLSEASCDQPVKLHQVVVVGHGDVSPPFEVAEDFSECDGLGHHQQRRGRTWGWEGFGSLVPAGMEIFEDGMGEALSVPVVMPFGDDPCCAPKLLACPCEVVDGSEQPIESTVSGDDLDVLGEINLIRGAGGWCRPSGGGGGRSREPIGGGP
jgi:hypothetical protein